ncbi:MAG: ferrous iron transport protein A [Dehalococcoidales bacterium]|nr:ferrous iron transport protein A [Dehalococcoidales bacterium]
MFDNNNRIVLTGMRERESGTILQITAGRGLLNRLSALGIMPGKKITKISSMLMRGPVMIQVDRTRIAIGHNMASRILVQRDTLEK